ncbi:hypothetical protein CDAR_591001 [Caerostris darwini]|uniref:Uncharacterized protein n=1 Tax=Caerostris darwini TaxID=1538125 RepID=A0AAV4Q0M7_9ARAC|nr:hypothetical protein CDAR_591001 [Caerostris darwini]
MQAEVDESGLFQSKCIVECERVARSVIALNASDGNGDFGGSAHSAAEETSLDGEERSFFHLDGLITGTHLNGTWTLNGVSSSHYLFPATDSALMQLVARRMDPRGG